MDTVVYCDLSKDQYLPACEAEAFESYLLSYLVQVHAKGYVVSFSFSFLSFFLNCWLKTPPRLYHSWSCLLLTVPVRETTLQL